MNEVKRTARWTEAVVIIGIILLVVAVAMPRGRYTLKAREAETKLGLHEVQKAVEKYAVDYDSYPRYLAGGESRWSAAVEVHQPRTAFRGTASCPELASLTDPLLAAGYMQRYPRNPFVREGIEVHQAQLTLPLNAPGGDPLRNGVETGRLHGTRFGAYCTSMGQLLGAKYYYPVVNVSPGESTKTTGLMEINLTKATTAPIPKLPPGADVTYPCWDVWTSNKASNPLPGEFIYAGTGPVTSLGNSSASGQYATLPIEINSYILAAFGGPRSKGKDIMDRTGNPFSFITIYPSRPLDGVLIQSGNPNGIRDGVILALWTGDYDEPGDL